MLSVNFVQNAYTVTEGDGELTICLQLSDVIEPTGAEVWVVLSFLESDAASSKFDSTRKS